MSIGGPTLLKIWFKNPQHVVDTRLKYVPQCQSIWPRYASYEEDKALRKDKWNAKYDLIRIVFWDNTNVDTLYKPSTALNQQITYSCYHAGNCANGGVYIQLCGWLGTEELWTGAVSGSKYQEKTGIFKLQ